MSEKVVAPYGKLSVRASGGWRVTTQFLFCFAFEKDSARVQLYYHSVLPVYVVVEII